MYRDKDKKEITEEAGNSLSKFNFNNFYKSYS